MKEYNATALVSVQFHGQTLTTLQHNGEPHVVMRPIVEVMGLDWKAQYDRIQRDEVLSSTMVMMTTVAEDGKQREMVSLPLKLLNGWLFGIDVSRVKPELRETITLYKRECYDALYRYWHEGAAVNPRFHPTPITPAQQNALQQIIARRAGEDGKIRAYVWSRFNNHFKLGSYKQLPTARFEEAVAYLEAMPLKGEKAEPPKALPIDLNYPLESAAPPVGCNGLAYYAFTQAKDWVDPGWELLMKLKAAGYNVEGPIYSHQAKIHVMTAMYNGLIGKAVESMNVACTSLTYAPIYLR